MIKNIYIQDQIDSHTRRAIEVDVELIDGTKRWCFFLTPEGAANCGDWIEGTKVRVHYGASNMFLVSEISKEVIEAAIKHAEKKGEIERCTLLIE